MATYEENYYRLMEERDRAKDRCAQMPFSVRIRDEYEEAEREFEAYCAIILERLMEDNADVLARLK